MSAFTLVELIVVITIVGILSTVGFVSYTGYLTEARDSNRYSQLTKLSDSLQVYAATNSLPLPDDSIEIQSGGETFAYQGYVGTDVLETIDYTNGGRDPKDDSFFTYMLTRDRKALQLMAVMEESVAFTPGITASYAVDYFNRYPVTYGNKLGVLTDIDNTPVQELSSVTGSLDVSSTTLALKSFLSTDEYVEDNLATLPQLQYLTPQKGRFWEVRDNEFTIECVHAPDIIVGNYSIAACNLGAEYLGEPGRFFQWGENIAWDNNPGSTSSNNCTWDRDTQGCTSPSLSAWSSTVSDTTIGGADRWYAWGDTRGPCPAGYRVPSVTDWQGIVTAGGWGTNGTAMQTALQLPYAGYRHWSDGTWLDGGSYGTYWSSSPSGPFGHFLYFDSSIITPSSTNTRPIGFSVRCFKN